MESIRRACDDGPKITLIVGHPTDYSSDAQILPDQTNGQLSPNPEPTEEKKE